MRNIQIFFFVGDNLYSMKWLRQQLPKLEDTFADHACLARFLNESHCQCFAPLDCSAVVVSHLLDVCHLNRLRLTIDIH